MSCIYHLHSLFSFTQLKGRKMKRRNFVQYLSTAAMLSPFFGHDLEAQSSKKKRTAAADTNDRQYWIKTLTRIAEPVLQHLSRQTLKESMPVEAVKGLKDERAQFTHLEAF